MTVCGMSAWRVPRAGECACVRACWWVLARARAGTGPQWRGLGCVANMAHPSREPYAMDPQVKTRSIEKTLLPLVTQVSVWPCCACCAPGPPEAVSLLVPAASLCLPRPAGTVFRPLHLALASAPTHTGSSVRTRGHRPPLHSDILNT